MGTSAHAGRGLGTPVPWGQLTPSVPAPGIPQEGLFGTQTQSTTMCPRAIMPPLCRPHCQWGQQRPPMKSQNVGDTHTLPCPDPTVSSSESPSPLNYLRKRVHVGQSEKQTSSQLMRCQRPRVGLVYGATVTTCEDSAPALPSPSQHDATSGPHRRSAHPGTRTHRPGTCHRWKSVSDFWGVFFFFLHSIRRSGGSSGVGGRTRPAHPRGARSEASPSLRKHVVPKSRSPPTPNFGADARLGNALP